MRKYHKDNPRIAFLAKLRYKKKPGNREKGLARAKRRRVEDPEGFKFMDFQTKLKLNYNLTVDQYHSLQEKQDFSCAICGADDRGNLYVDHKHGETKVRGLLCNQCNTAIGLMQDDPAVLQRAVHYVSV